MAISTVDSLFSTDSKDFSWVYLIDFFLAIVTVIFIVFYVNRVFGSLASLALRWLVWKKYRMVVKVQSIQLSLLGGRIFFKNLTCISSNDAISILQGSITWRYWLLYPQKTLLELASAATGEEGADKSGGSRLALDISGFEWFIFNRTDAYKAMEEFLNKENPNPADLNSFTSSSADWVLEKGEDALTDGGIYSYLQLFPIFTKCNNGSIVLGNKETPCLLIFHFKNGRSLVDVAPATYKNVDQHKLMFSATLQSARMEMRPNVDYEEGSSKAGVFTMLRRKQETNAYPWWGRLFPKSLQKRFFPPEADMHSVGPSQWHGLSQYQDDSAEYLGYSDAERNEYRDKIPEEYGKSSAIIEAPELTLNYYFDIPGIHRLSNTECGPPKWGMEIDFKETTTIHYGPWADRQRLPLQSMMMPRFCKDQVYSPQAEPGSKRSYGSFDMFIIFRKECVLQIPTREMSKDKAFYEKLANGEITAEARPYGWIELKAQQDSNISFVAAMEAQSENGWVNTVKLDLRRPEIRTSVNHDIMLRSNAMTCDIDIEMPLKWNGLQNYFIDIRSSLVDLYLLREHVSLMSDLFTDFSDGEPVAYDMFTPVKYHLSWNITDYQLFLNLNEANLINSPTDPDENLYLTFEGKLLSVSVMVPLDEIFPLKRTLDISFKTPEFSMKLFPPPWHSLNAFLVVKEIGIAQNVAIDIEYTICSVVREGMVDLLKIDIDGSDVRFLAFGFALRYLMRVRENYFGEYVHFQTVEEYGVDHKTQATTFTNIRTDNDTDVQLQCIIDNAMLVLAGNLYNASSGIRLYAEQFDVDLRFTNYYMDLQANISPFYGYAFSSESDDPFSLRAFTRPDESVKVDLMLQGLVARGNRLFGLPPTEPTYFCKWDFDIGDIVIDSHISILNLLGNVGQSLGFGFKDEENSMNIPEPELHDVTQLSVKVSMLRLKCHNGPGCLQVVAGPVSMSFFDLASESYSKKVSISIPEISVLAILTDPNAEEPTTTASFVTSIYVTNFERKALFEEQKKKQMTHISVHDAPFKRISFLTDKTKSDQRYQTIKRTLAIFPIPSPLTSSSHHIPLSQTISHIRSPSTTTTGSVRNITASSVDNDEDPGLTDAFVIQLGPVNLSLTPGCCQVAVHLFDGLQHKSIESTLDALQVELFRQFDNIAMGTKKTAEFRIVLPEVNIKHFELHDEGAIYLHVVDLNLAVRHVHIQRPQTIVKFMESPDVIDSISVQADIGLLEVGLNPDNHGSFRSMPITLQVSDSCAWLSKRKEGFCGYVQLKGIDAIANAPDLIWAAAHLNRQVSCYQNLNLDFNSFDKQRTADAVYKLTMADSMYEAGEPSTLTKRATIIQHGSHIRGNDSWKIMVKLRYIYHSLDFHWRLSQNQATLANNYPVPKNAENKVVRVFSLWYTWEISNVAQKYIFSHVYSPATLKDEIFKSTFTVMLELDAINLNILHNNSNDMVEVGRTKLVFDVDKSLPQNMTNVGITLILGDTTVEVSEDFLKLVLSQSFNLPRRDPVEKSSKDIDNVKGSEEIDGGNSNSVCLQTTLLMPLVKVGFRTNYGKLSSKIQNVKASLLMNDKKSVSFLSRTSYFHVNVEAYENSARHLVSLLSLQDVALTLTCTAEHENAFATLVVKSVYFDIGEVETILLFADRAASSLLNFKELADALQKPVKEEKSLLPVKEDGPDDCAPSRWSVHLRNDLCQINLNGISPHVVSYQSSLFTLDLTYDISFEAFAACESHTLRLSANDVVLISLLLEGLTVSGQAKDLQREEIISTLARATATMEIIEVKSGAIHQVYQELPSLLARIEDASSAISERLPNIQKKLSALSETKILDEKRKKPSKDLLFDTKIEIVHTSFGLIVDGDQIRLAIDNIWQRVSNMEYGESVEASLSALDYYLDIGSVEIGVLLWGRAIQNFISTAATIHCIQGTEKETPHQFILHCPKSRVLGSPKTVAKLIDYVFLIKQLEAQRINTFAKGSLKESSSTSSPSTTTTSQVKTPTEIEDSWPDLLKKFSCTISIEDVSVAWLFESVVSETEVTLSVPGITVGYESLSIIFKNLSSAISLKGFYITPAVNPSIYPHKVSSSLANTAFLPSVSLKGVLVESNLVINLTGESFVVTLEPSIVELVFEMMRSIDRINIARSFSSGNNDLQTLSADEVTNNSSLDLKFSKNISLHVHFDAAFCYLWDSVADKRHALKLQSPTIDIAGEYRVHKEGHDSALLQVNVGSSSNQIEPTVVPVLVKIYNSVKSHMADMENDKSHLYRRPSRMNSVVTIASRETSASTSANSLFNLEMQVQASLIFGRQEVILTCGEDTRIAASLSYDSLSITLTSLKDEAGKKTYPVCVRLRNFKMSLQHVYSRLTSGQLEISNIDLFVTKKSIIFVTGHISDIHAEVNMLQMEDLEIFRTVWRPHSILVNKSTVQVEEKLVDRYHKAMTTIAIAWFVEGRISNVTAVLEMGQAIGSAQFEMDELNLVAQKTSSWSEMMRVGFGSITLTCEGRLSGAAKLSGARIFTLIEWNADVSPPSAKSNDGALTTSRPVPFVDVLVGFSNLELRLGIDFHDIFIIFFEKISLTMTNRLRQGYRLRETIDIDLSLGQARLYATDLSASYFVDVHALLARMRKHSSDSVKERMKSMGVNETKRERSLDPALTNILANLVSAMKVEVSVFTFYVFPRSFTECSNVFVTEILGIRAAYSQFKALQRTGSLIPENELVGSIHQLQSALDLKMDGLMVALTTLKKAKLPNVGLDVISFVKHANDRKGGVIVQAPFFAIKMKTWQKIGDSEVEFTFESHFGGKVDLKWNLGIVQIISAMFTTHKEALASRKDYYALRPNNLLSDISIDETKVELASRYSYLAREVPIIDTPTLRDLGDATPPMEWFGLHRDKLPGLTHQVLMVGLQMLAHELELLYEEVLGRS